MSAFNNMVDTCRYHNFGGTTEMISCEPYITGYGFIKWYLPQQINDYLGYSTQVTNDQTSSAPDKDEAAKYLSAACVGVTPPSESLTFVEYEGSCGVTFGNPGKLTYGNTLNIKYLEMSGLPIYRIHKVWLEMIRENKTGLDTSPPYSDQNNRKDNYAGKVLYWTTKPDGVTVEFFALYSGVVPSRSQQDNFATDISSIDKVEIDYEYHIDYVWNDKWVYDLAVSTAKESPYGAAEKTRYLADGFVKSLKVGHGRHIANTSI